MKTIERLPYAEVQFKDGELRSVDYQDIYFQADYALAESIHVYLAGNHLFERFKSSKKHTVILELGFGAGVNFLNTLNAFKQHRGQGIHLSYIAIEHKPLAPNVLKDVLSSFPEFEPFVHRLYQQYPMPLKGIHRLHFDSVSLTLILDEASAALERLMHTNANRLLPNFSGIDAVYLDGFSINKNPAMWEKHLLHQLRSLMKDDATLASFSVAKPVIDSLVSAGFVCTKGPGVGRKRQVLRARVLGSSTDVLATYPRTPWSAIPKTASLDGKVAIIGGGLAGAMTAHRLANRGIAVDLYEQSSQLGMMGSGNQQALLDFNPSLADTKLNQLMFSSLSFADNFYSLFPDCFTSGLLRLFEGSKREKSVALTKLFPEWFQLLEGEETNRLTGLSLNRESLNVALGGTIRPKPLIQQLVNHPLITVLCQRPVCELRRAEQYWQIANQHYTTVILANSYGLRLVDPDTDYVSPYPGSLYCLKSTGQLSTLSIAISGLGHISPTFEGVCQLGYHPDLTKLLQIDESVIISSRAAVRAKTYDYLPLVGPVPNRQQFLSDYKKLSDDPNYLIESKPALHPNLFMLSGFGSHGVTTIPLMSEYLVNLLFNEPLPISHSLMEAVHPGRALVRELVKGVSR